MRKLSNLAMACLGTAAMLVFSGASLAEGNAVSVNLTNGKNIFENGKADTGSVRACATCHGDKAMGQDAMKAPRLANIGYVYIRQTADEFR